MPLGAVAMHRDARQRVRPDARAPAPIGVGWRQSHYAQLLQERPTLDFLEVHSENFFGQGGAALAVLEQGRANYPVSLHGVGLSLGSAQGLDLGHLEQLACLVDRIEPLRVSDHACFARGVLDGRPVHAADLLPLPFTGAALDVLCANVQRVQDRLQQRLAVENLSAYLRWNTPAERDMPETEFLNALARRSGCVLLVDVNNIYVNALNASAAGRCTDPLLACKEWLQAIDPGSVAELHLAGHCHVQDAYGAMVIDDHGSRVCNAVWQLYAHALACFGPVPSLIEWDTDVPALSVLLEEAARARGLAAVAANTPA